jgi:rfaE bifunctional protein nucleotidyltransferase chain/domain
MTKYSESLLEKIQNFEQELKKKYIEPNSLMQRCAELKAQGLSLATLNGSFDLMHAGHLYTLFEAKKQADILIVALNSDSSIKAYKSKDRPIIDLDNRMKMMASCQWVDYVTYFDETDPCQVLLKIRPDVHVNGAEYGAECLEKPTLDLLGARLHLVERIPGLATTDIIKKIHKL